MRKVTLFATATWAIPGLLASGLIAPAWAACPFQNTEPVKMLTSSAPAWQAVVPRMQECANVQVEMDLQYKEKQPSAMATRPALYQIAGLAINSLVPLLNDGTVRPLDGLVEKYGEQLQPNQLIRINGKVMAIAMMVNIPALIYREDIFKAVDAPAPKTYDELLTTLEKIRKAGIMQYPLSGNYKAGWDLATEFVSMYFGFGGQFFGSGNVATVNGEAGRKSLEMMKRLTAYMDPEYLSSDSNAVVQQLERGRTAVANTWSGRSGQVYNSKADGLAGRFASAAAPAAMPGGKPATTVWWDGFSIATNATDAQAEAAFRVALHGISEEMVKANNDTALWLIRGYQPGPPVAGAVASAQGGAPGYPATTAMGLMHTALANNLAGFFTGQQGAEQTLARVEAAYTAAAKEKGLLR